MKSLDADWLKKVKQIKKQFVGFDEKHFRDQMELIAYGLIENLY
jgi:hypothetical protein